MALAPQIREAADTIEAERCLSPAVVRAMKEVGVFCLAMVYVHRVAKEVVTEMYDTAATSAIFQTHPLDRQMRDILAACQHRVVHGKMYWPAVCSWGSIPRTHMRHTTRVGA